jgi:glucose/arabinose dehydrogenase
MACNLTNANDASSSFQATVPPSQIANAPIYTATPTFTPSNTPTITPTPTATPTLPPTPTETLPPSPTKALIPPTAPVLNNAPASIQPQPAGFSEPSGWSCEDFPCEDDIEGFLERIQVPPGFAVEHVGQFPGQPMQITYGLDGRLYATVLENGTQNGAVYAMDVNGESEHYAGEFVSPIGLAFQPGTDVLYVSSRVTLQSGGALWRITAKDAQPELVLDDLPCCFSLIENQPAGMTFGADGYLYLGVGSLTDHAESQQPESKPFADIQPLEASILRIQPHTSEIAPFAQGLRYPYDVALDSTGQLYATDQGIIAGPGDRLLAIAEANFYGWPFWKNRGCEACPVRPGNVRVEDDLFPFPDRSLPRGLVAYTGSQFPANYFDNLFVVLWNGSPDAQRIVRLDPRDLPQPPEEDMLPTAEPFMTGLIRPIDVTVAPDGSLVVADFIYGHVWRVRYGGE